MEYLYLTSLLVSLGMLFWLKLFDVRNSVTQYVNLLIIILSNLGSYFLSIATSTSEAIIAQKITYIGGVFLPVFYLMLVLEICHIEFPRSIGVLLLSVQCVIYGFVCTIGTNDLFYKGVELTQHNGNNVLKHGYGPVHTIHLILMYSYLIAAILVTIYSFVKKKAINRIGVIVMLILSCVAVGTYIFEKVTGMDYDVMPIAFVLLMLGVLFPVYNDNLFTVYEKKDIIDEQLGKIGFLTFDKKRIYQDCNDFMANVFPELINYNIGQKIEGCSFELQNLINQIDQHEELHRKNLHGGHTHTAIEPFWLNDRCYEGTIHAVTNSFGHIKGYTIELRDDTVNRQNIELKERYADELTREVHEKTKKIRSIQQKTIMGIAQMVESRDLSTGGHIKRTSDVVRIFSKELLKTDLGFDKQFLHLVIRSAPMHDIGKIGVDDAILRKQGKFTDEEYSAMKKHSEIGYHMVKEILSGVEEDDFVRVAENVAHYHHEKINGTGYPHGLKGDEIPVEARIMALADVFDALVSKRCYKEAFSYDRAFDIIAADSGSHFDKQLAEVFISCRPKLEEYYDNYQE